MYVSPKLSDEQRANFETLVRAAKADQLMLASCTDAETGEPVAVICAVNYNPGDPEGEYQLVPVAKQFAGDPYEELNPPSTEQEKSHEPH